ncbi:hypothetical protein NMB32_20430 [Stenotrophomonas sp. CD2]|nr:hypothetical protein NMB32_20430 [Stenotrophomonas sp. CD2]
MAAGPTRNREKLLDDLLSLGRNWALAIAIAGAGAAVHYSESVYEAGIWRGLLPTICFWSPSSGSCSASSAST